MKLCLADTIHNVKWVKSIQIWQTVFKYSWVMSYFIFNMFKDGT